MNQRLLGIVLCGGRSLRMGTDKATLPHAGTTFLGHAIQRLRKICDAVAVSGQTTVMHDMATIDDPVQHRGPATGIAASLRYARDHQFDACLVTPVDTPALTDEDLAKLRDRWRRADQLVLACAERIEPLIGIYPVELTESLEQLAGSVDRSLFRWIAGTDHTTLPFPADHLHNINTVDDLSNHGCQ